MIIIRYYSIIYKKKKNYTPNNLFCKNLIFFKTKETGILLLLLKHHTRQIIKYYSLTVYNIDTTEPKIWICEFTDRSQGRPKGSLFNSC